MKKITSYLVTLLVGIGLGTAGMYRFYNPSRTDLQQPRITQLSGEPISHRDYSTRGQTFTFITEAQGKGTIRTEIPKTMIPEADAWMNRVHGIQATAGYIPGVTDRIPMISLSYWYRWNALAIGGGIYAVPMAHSATAGLFGGVQYWLP